MTTRKLVLLVALYIDGVIDSVHEDGTHAMKRLQELETGGFNGSWLLSGVPLLYVLDDGRLDPVVLSDSAGSHYAVTMTPVVFP